MAAWAPVVLEFGPGEPSQLDIQCQMKMDTLGGNRGTVSPSTGGVGVLGRPVELALPATLNSELIQPGSHPLPPFPQVPIWSKALVEADVLCPVGKVSVGDQHILRTCHLPKRLGGNHLREVLPKVLVGFARPLARLGAFVLSNPNGVLQSDHHEPPFAPMQLVIRSSRLLHCSADEIHVKQSRWDMTQSRAVEARKYELFNERGESNPTLIYLAGLSPNDRCIMGSCLRNVAGKRGRRSGQNALGDAAR